MNLHKVSFRIVLFLFVFCLPFTVEAANVQELFQQVNPAVVEIKTLSINNVAVSLEKDEFIKKGGLGSGVLISEDGKVLTAAHVVQTADKVMVEFLDGEIFNAKVVTSAPWADIALLQLDRAPKGKKTAILGDSDSVQVGERVFVIGAPYGLSHTLTVGYISSRHLDDGMTGNFAQIELFQTDAAVNTGNSGGPMFNMNGEVVGVVSHIKSRSGGNEGISFAVTSNIARDIIEGEGFWTGIEGYFLTGRMANIFNVPQNAGILVQYIAENSMASRLGIKPSSIPARIGNKEILVGGDIILSISDLPISST